MTLVVLFGGRRSLRGGPERQLFRVVAVQTTSPLYDFSQVQVIQSRPLLPEYTLTLRYSTIECVCGKSTNILNSEKKYKDNNNNKITFGKIQMFLKVTVCEEGPSKVLGVSASQ